MRFLLSCECSAPGVWLLLAQSSVITWMVLSLPGVGLRPRVARGRRCRSMCGSFGWYLSARRYPSTGAV